MATITKGKSFINGELVTPASLHQLVDSATVSGIVNADISATAAIVDTKLATISTTGKVANSATTATNANTASAIVARDASGNFSAGTITANLSGNATNVTGTVALANGGTGATTAAAARTNLGLGNSATLNTGTESGTVAAGNDARFSDARTPTSHAHGNLTNAGAIGTTANLPVVTTASGVLTTIPAGIAGQVLTSNGSNSAPSFQALGATSTNANNLTGGSAGTVPYQSAAGTTAMLAAGSAGQVLRSNGAAAPSWLTLSEATTSAAGFMSSTDKTKLDGIATNANNYSHPTGDGNLHVPATSTTNNGKLLMAGPTAGNISWQTLTPTNIGAAASSHAHGSLTSDGKIGTAAGVPIITGTSGVLQAGSFGTTAGSYCQGNDSRLSDARTPTDSSVTSTKIASSAVTADKLAADAVTESKIQDNAVTTNKIGPAQQVAAAWVSLDGDIEDIAVSGTTFTRVSDTVVRVTRTNHGVLNQDCVCFNNLASPNNYLNGTWLVSGVTSNTFDFTISGSTVPSGALTAQIIRVTRIKRKFRISKVGRLSNGNYRVFFENALNNADYIVLGSALYGGDPRMGVGPTAQTVDYCDVRTSYYNGTEYNVDPLNVVVFGGF